MKIASFLYLSLILISTATSQSTSNNFMLLAVGNKWFYQYEHHSPGPLKVVYAMSEIANDRLVCHI